MLLPYPKLIHADDNARIAEFQAHYPRLLTLTYTIEEKVLGVPFQLCFSAGDGFVLAVRDRILKDGEDMHGLRKALSAVKLQRLFQMWRRQCHKEHKELNVFGVLVNAEGAIPTGVDYGEDATILCTDAARGGKMLSRRAMVSLFSAPDCRDRLVPRYVTMHSLKDALQFPIEAISSKVIGVEFTANPPAGVVIKPYQASVVVNDCCFYLKRENDPPVLKVEEPVGGLRPPEEIVALDELEAPNDFAEGDMEGDMDGEG